MLLDHVLDAQSGLQVMRDAQAHTTRFGLAVTWVLLSSTEDQYTINKYYQEGIEMIIHKPLTLDKIRSLIEKFGDDDNVY